MTYSDQRVILFCIITDREVIDDVKLIEKNDKILAELVKNEDLQAQPMLYINGNILQELQR